MPRNIVTIPFFRKLLCLFAVAASLWLAPSAVLAQVAIPPEALPNEAVLRQVLNRGQELEAQGRWGEALAHYEQAAKDYPDRKDIQDHLIRVRLHYDVCRRYEDTSFTAVIDRSSRDEALGVYREVLNKIETHYVSPPDWQKLTEQGVNSVTAGLSEPSFQKCNGLTAPVSDIDAFCAELTRRMAITNVRNSREAQEVAENVATMAWERLSLRPQAIVMEFVCGAIGSLDKYSCFLTGSQLEDVFSQIEGSFVGLGIELKAENQALRIIRVIPNGSAEQAGIRPGDKIVAVDNVSTDEVSTDQAADMLKGPEGSVVTLTIVDADNRTKQVQVVRRRVDVSSVGVARIMDSQYGVGYIRLTSFQKTTCRDVDSALWQLHRQGMKSLIIDIRGNPGGLLTAAVDLADKFVDSGNLVSTRGRNAREDFDYRAHVAGTWRVPLVVLIDRDTASASEIFAGAIRDHRRGTVVGQTSYGKGCVQGIFSLTSAQAGLRLTTAKFYSPNGNAISHRGVQPDLAVHETLKPNGEGLEDAILTAGLQIARNRMLSQRHEVSPGFSSEAR